MQFQFRNRLHNDLYCAYLVVGRRESADRQRLTGGDQQGHHVVVDNVSLDTTLMQHFERMSAYVR